MVRLATLLVFAFVGAILSALGDVRRPRNRDRTLKWLAKRLAGTHEPQRWDYNGAVTWNLDGATAVFYFLESEGGRGEGVALRLRKSCNFRLRLSPETGWARVRRFFGAQDLQTGDAAFDRTFMVQSNSESSARAVLTREVRAAMIALDGFTPVTLDLGPAGIALRTGLTPGFQPDRLASFGGEALTLGRALLQALNPSVVISEVESLGVGICPVCSTPVDEDRCLCTRCRTPHHKDCWSYLGGCAVYACAGRPRRMRTLPRRNPDRAA
jgi:hypothetical protein